MPNWVTNKVNAPQHVLASLINESGKIDFNQVIKFKGSFEWDGVRCDAEQVAEIITQAPLDDNPVIARLQELNRRDVNVLKMDDMCFEQFVQMLRNKRQCGYFHEMDFARDQWGTKWNACQQSTDLEAGNIQFETAWSCPVPVFIALSMLHPDHELVVHYADEDIGSNCGMLTIKNGEVVSSEIAGRWSNMDEQERQHWTKFARDVTGSQEELEDDE
ncbi:hypothetical protein [Aeromonas caviae]|uniref:DUF1281 family ferredoxin-like fold protein n=1 Tax=Aeromonas caviae TaxID=648 RepID=UPI003F745128